MMGLSIWYPVHIDRINMTLPSISKTVHGFVISQLEEIKALAHDLVPNGSMHLTQNNYVTRLDYYPVKKRKIADIEVGVTKSGHCYFRLGLYPSKFLQGEFEHFKQMLNNLLPNFSYQKLYTFGRITYIELAIDTPSHKQHSFIPFRRKITKSLVYTNPDGSKGSIYLGSTKSAYRYCIYNKHKQQSDKNMKPKYSQRTRIEHRAKCLKLKPFELEQQLPNPFIGLEIADLDLARKLSEEVSWQMFLDQCLELGSAAALMSYPKQARKAFTELLREAAPWWWEPQRICVSYKTAMAVIEP